MQLLIMQFPPSSDYFLSLRSISRFEICFDSDSIAARNFVVMLNPPPPSIAQSLYNINKINEEPFLQIFSRTVA